MALIDKILFAYTTLNTITQYTYTFLYTRNFILGYYLSIDPPSKISDSGNLFWTVAIQSWNWQWLKNQDMLLNNAHGWTISSPRFSIVLTFDSPPFTGRPDDDQFWKVSKCIIQIYKRLRYRAKRLSTWEVDFNDQGYNKIN